MSMETRSYNPANEDPLEIDESDIDRALEGGVFSKEATEQGLETSELKARAAEFRSKVRELEKSVDRNMLGRQAEELLSLRQIRETADYDSIVDETVDRFYGMLDESARKDHTKAEMKVLVEAAVVDALKKKIKGTAEDQEQTN